MRYVIEIKHKDIGFLYLLQFKGRSGFLAVNFFRNAKFYNSFTFVRKFFYFFLESQSSKFLSVSIRFVSDDYFFHKHEKRREKILDFFK